MLTIAFFISCALNIVQGYTLDYKGFDDCGSGGWHCNSNGTDYEVSYECGGYNGWSARIWVWTARIPSRTTILRIDNCRHVELHMDCTTGYRSYNLKQFRVSNTEFLEILPPLRPRVFLHDNDEVAHAPPEMILTNVNNVKWAERTFDKAMGRCRTKQQYLRRLSFDNVKFVSPSEATLVNLSLDSLLVTGSKFSNSIPKNWLNISASTIEISNNTIAIISTEGLQFEAEQVAFFDNTIEVIDTTAITSRSNSFEFSRNKVQRVYRKGFDVFSRKANFSANEWNTIDTNAFVDVAPGQKISDKYIIAEKFVFQFSNNTVAKISDNSLHPNYHAYKSVCSSIIVERNSLPCTCTLPFEDPAMNKTREWWQHFYGELVLTESNFCAAAPNCSLQQTLMVLQRQNCSESVHAEAVCTNITAQYYTPTEEPTTPRLTEAPTYQPNPVIADDYPQNESVIPAQHTQDASGSKTIIFALTGAVVGVAVVAGLLYAVNKLKRESNMKLDASYQHQRNVATDDDEEQLVVE